MLVRISIIVIDIKFGLKYCSVLIIVKKWLLYHSESLYFLFYVINFESPYGIEN